MAGRDVPQAASGHEASHRRGTSPALVCLSQDRLGHLPHACRPGPAHVGPREGDFRRTFQAARRASQDATHVPSMLIYQIRQFRHCVWVCVAGVTDYLFIHEATGVARPANRMRTPAGDSATGGCVPTAYRRGGNHDEQQSATHPCMRAVPDHSGLGGDEGRHQLLEPWMGFRLHRPVVDCGRVGRAPRGTRLRHQGAPPGPPCVLPGHCVLRADGPSAGIAHVAVRRSWVLRIWEKHSIRTTVGATRGPMGPRATGRHTGWRTVAPGRPL